MRFVAAITTIAVLLSCDWTTYAAQESGLLVGFHVDEYFSDAYTAKSREDAVFFQGEPILFRLIVRNMGPVETALAITSPDPKQLFRIEGFRAPALPRESTKRRRWLGERFDDEVNFVLPVSVSPPVKAVSAGTQDLTLESRTALGPGESVQWILSVSSENLQPQHYYRFVVKVNGTEDGKNPLRDFANIRFELRPNSGEARPEILRREALRRFFRYDYVGAREAVADLLRIHPNSYEAYRTLEMIAERQGLRDEARTHQGNANAILKGRRDELLLKFAPAGRLAH